MRKKWKSTHTHHKVPKHMGGTDEPSNLIELSVEEHAEAHRVLFETYGNIRDKIAWLCLSGRRKEAEPYRIALAIEGFQKFVNDPEKSSKWKEKISKSITGKIRSIESREKQSKTTLELYKTGKIKIPELTPQKQEFLRLNYQNCREALANGRRNSQKWKNSVTSEEYRLKKSESDPRSQKISVNGIVYPSIRRATKLSGVERKFFNKAKSSPEGVYRDEHHHIIFL